MLVKPTTSTKTTLTTLRSRATAERASSVPHVVQNTMPGASGPAPQAEQVGPSTPPQRPQKTASPVLRKPHAGQPALIALPVDEVTLPLAPCGSAGRGFRRRRAAYGRVSPTARECAGGSSRAERATRGGESRTP